MNFFDQLSALAVDPSNRTLAVALLWIIFRVELLHRASRSHAHRLLEVEVRTGVRTRPVATSAGR